MTMADPESTPERFELYRKYQMAVHNDPPDEITEAGFKRFLVESPLVDARSEAVQRTAKTKFGTFHQLYRLNGRLIAVGVVDILPNSVSSVYLFYDPDERHLVLGKYTALQEIEFCKSVGLEYYVMGFYIHSCIKMRYKGEYKPSELLCPTTLEWVPLSESTPILNKFNFSPLEPHLAAQRALIPVGMYRPEVREDCDGEGEGGSDVERRVEGDEGDEGGGAAEALGHRGDGDGHAEHGGEEARSAVTTIGDDEAGDSETSAVGSTSEISSPTNSTPTPTPVPAKSVSSEKRDAKDADSHEADAGVGAEAALREQLVDFVAEFDFGASNIGASTKGSSEPPSPLPWTLVGKADSRRCASDGGVSSGGGGVDGTLSRGPGLAAAPMSHVRARRDFVASISLDVGAGRPLHMTHLTEQGKRLVEPLLEEWVQLAGPVAKHIVVKFC